MRHVRHKLGLISDLEFYEQERKENLIADTQLFSEQSKQKKLIEENFDTLFDTKKN